MNALLFATVVVAVLVMLTAWADASRRRRKSVQSAIRIREVLQVTAIRNGTERTFVVPPESLEGPEHDLVLLLHDRLGVSETRAAAILGDLRREAESLKASIPRPVSALSRTAGSGAPQSGPPVQAHSFRRLAPAGAAAGGRTVRDTFRSADGLVTVSLSTYTEAPQEIIVEVSTGTPSPGEVAVIRGRLGDVWERFAVPLATGGQEPDTASANGTLRLTTTLPSVEFDAEIEFLSVQELVAEDAEFISRSIQVAVEGTRRHWRRLASASNTGWDEEFRKTVRRELGSGRGTS
ncbi:hypothetical protein [Streptomyces sp. NPDC046197]|uniref:hypothetical protein n=1 Tax=Streptomyces sp. NPDC046197 TaxID=3154337 RepID=UPI0033EE4F7F